MSEKIAFTTDDNEEVMFEVVEQTTINGALYLLVTDGEEDAEEADAYIMKQVGSDGDELSYEMVEDETELQAVWGVFEELLDDSSEV